MCIAVACPSLIVANSDAAIIAVTGSTEAFQTVTCTNGYESTDGFAFTVNCIGDPDTAGTSKWENVLTCEG